MKTMLPWGLITVLSMGLGCGKDRIKPTEQPAPPEQEAARPAPPEQEAAQSEVVTLAISCASIGMSGELCRSGAAAWARKTGHKVNLVVTPMESYERLLVYKQLLAAGSPDVDVYEIDVIWPGELADHLVDLRQYSGGAEKQHFAAMIQNNTVDGKLVAMPWYIDTGVLYYRKDLLAKYGKKPPTTWAELTATARTIQEAERKAGNREMWGFVWQGKAYEGLTCNALEWIASHGGGTIVEPDGTISIDNAKAAAALDMAASWVGTVSPRNVLSFTEEDSRAVFQFGNAVFLRSWPYAWSLAQADDSKIKDKVGVMALPRGGKGGRHAAALVGWQLAVSKHSRHPAIAADLIMYLTGAAEQKRRALEGAYNPTIRGLYQDQGMLAAHPVFGGLLAAFDSAVPRPSTATRSMYGPVSIAFFDAVHSVIAGKSRGADASKALAAKLDAIRNGEWK